MAADGGGNQKTSWTLVERAASPDPHTRKEALELLWRRYYPPLFTYLTVRRHLQHATAEEVLSSFFAKKILEKNILAKADRTRGSKFRSFLLTTLWRFALTWLGQNQEELSPGPDDQPTPTHDDEDALDVEWAKETLAETLRRVRAYCADETHAGWWELFVCCILDPTLNNIPAPPYKDLAVRLGALSPCQISNRLASVKRLYERTLREILAEDLSGDRAQVQAAVEQDIGDLLEILSRSA